MNPTTLLFTAEYDLPRSIVWEALVDPDLLSGWLAEATVDVHEARWDLAWQSGGVPSASRGVITELQPPAVLTVSTSNVGLLSFELDERPGGSRGTFTLLRLRVDTDTDPRFAPSIRADWRCNLDQLGELLRGHPVDWSRWQEEYGAVWVRYRGEAAAGTA